MRARRTNDRLAHARPSRYYGAVAAGVARGHRSRSYVGSRGVVLTGVPSRSKPQVRALSREAKHVCLEHGDLVITVPAHSRIMQRLKPEQRADLVRAYTAGSTVRELAEQLGMHRTTVVAHLRRDGVPLRPHGLSPNQLNDSIRLYQSGWSLRRIGARYGCNAETVRTSLRRLGVQLRKPWERGSIP